MGLLQRSSLVTAFIFIFLLSPRTLKILTLKPYWIHTATFAKEIHELGIATSSCMNINRCSTLRLMRCCGLLWFGTGRFVHILLNYFGEIRRSPDMMTSSNGNIFRVTGHLCGEFVGPMWIPPHKGQWRGAWMFSLICVWINGWVNNREAGDLRRYRAHYDVIVMEQQWRNPGC